MPIFALFVNAGVLFEGAFFLWVSLRWAEKSILHFVIITLSPFGKANICITTPILSIFIFLELDQIISAKCDLKIFSSPPYDVLQVCP